MNNREKFDRWIVQPLVALWSVPEGNGSFVALLATMAVLRGLVKARWLKENESEQLLPDINKLPSWPMIGDFLGIKPSELHAGWMYALDTETWQMFMIPQKMLRIDSSYGALPTPGDDGRWEVDPWKFVDLVLAKADENMDLIDEGYFPLMRAYVEQDE